MGDTFNFNGSIGQFIAKGDGHIEHYHAQSMASSSTSSPEERQNESPDESLGENLAENLDENLNGNLDENLNGSAEGNHGEAIPPELATQKAQGVLQALQRIGLLDEEAQPMGGLSWAERGYLAQQIAYKLGIEYQWKTFAQLWNCDAASLRSGYNRAKDMPKMAAFDEKIKDIVG